MDAHLEALGDALAPGRARRVGRDVEVQLPSGGSARFRVAESPSTAPRDRPWLVLLGHADRRTLTELRRSGVSFVTASGHVYLTAPGFLVDIRPSRSPGPPDRGRNPFSPRGRGVCVALLLDPERRWTVRELAAAASASESFVSRVVTSLHDEGLVELDGGRLSAYPEALFVALAEHWPKADTFFAGRPPGENEAVVGGGPAFERLGIAVPAIPRIYVNTRQELRRLAVETASTPATARLAQWEAVIQPLSLGPGFVPPLICALELARDPRGREVLRNRSLVSWPVHL